ncbi:MAG: hypothetical protein PF440_12120 [Thiomicrorhabdus sp.]|jgi:hypothetical protein|nr:hypothetical protein [Thiomicrorhabdus sp.]
MKFFKGLMIGLAISMVFWVCAYQVFAAPFIVCDVDPEATSYVVQLDSGQQVEVPAPLHYDLNGIEEGAHVAQVWAKNVWGLSENASPLEFTKALPQSATNTRLSSE